MGFPFHSSVAYSTHAQEIALIGGDHGRTRWTFGQPSSYFHKIVTRFFLPGHAVSFQITVLKVLAGHPEGRASLADLTRCVSILISSGTDWTNRTKRLAARAPKLDIFGDSFVLRDDHGWQITEGGRQFLASLEAPIPVTSQHEQAPDVNATEATTPSLPPPPPLRLVVNNDHRPHRRPGDGPTRRRSA